MRAIERTTARFIESVRHVIPDAAIQVSRSKMPHGRSNYVYMTLRSEPPAPWRMLKVRISDHPVGMRRALLGQEDLYIDHRAKPASWAVWLGRLAARVTRTSPIEGGGDSAPLP